MRQGISCGIAAPAHLQCLRCRRRYPVVSMPSGCPSCSEEAAPANVWPVYGRLPALKPGRLSGRGLGRYAAQLPVARERLVSLGEGGTPLLAVPAAGAEVGLRRLIVKDERRNPTGSWRDRYAALALAGLDEPTTVGGAGDDSLAVALAAYAARAGARSVSLVPRNVGMRTRDAIDAVGGRAIAVAGPVERWRLLAEAERALGWRALTNRTSPPIGGDPLAIEGYKTIAYEIVEDLALSAPDFVAVPAGLGDGVQGIWRGFRELAAWGVIDHAPRMVAVEVSGAVASALAAGRDWVEPSPDVQSSARVLGGITGTVQTLQAVMESEGLVVRVSDAELDAARIRLGEHEGIWADLGAAAPVAAALKLTDRASIPARSQFVAVVTESGALDESSAAPGDLDVAEPRVDELLRALAVRSD
jgi:threonine synthase